MFENLLDGSEHFALIKGSKNNTKGKSYFLKSCRKLFNQSKLPNSFNNTLKYFKKFNNCVLIFIRDINLKSVSQTLKDYKNKLL